MHLGAYRFLYCGEVVGSSSLANARIPPPITGLPNTERGHCGKLEFMLKYFSQACADEYLIPFPQLLGAEVEATKLGLVSKPEDISFFRRCSELV